MKAASDVRAVRQLLASNRNFRLLLASGLISLTGDWILRVGLTYEVYTLTGSTLASGALLATSLVPQLALGSAAGVIVDRWSRRRVMIVVDVLLAAALLPLLEVRSADDVWIVYPVSLAAAVLIQFLTPAEAAMAPLVVGEEPGDLRDVGTGEGEHEQSARSRDVRVRTRQVAAEGRLTVGPDRDESPRCPAVGLTAVGERPIAAAPWYSYGWGGVRERRAGRDRGLISTPNLSEKPGQAPLDLEFLVERDPLLGDRLLVDDRPLEVQRRLDRLLPIRPPSTTSSTGSLLTGTISVLRSTFADTGSVSTH